MFRILSRHFRKLEASVGFCTFKCELGKGLSGLSLLGSGVAVSGLVLLWLSVRGLQDLQLRALHFGGPPCWGTVCADPQSQSIGPKTYTAINPKLCSNPRPYKP